MNKRSASNLKTVLIYIAVFILIVFIISRITSNGKKEELKYSDVIRYFTEEKVVSFSVSNKDVLSMYLKDDPKKAVTYELKSTDYFREDLGDLINEQIASGILTEVEYQPDVILPWWVSFLPYVILLVLFVVLYIFMINQAGRNGKMNGFGRARVKTQDDSKEKVTFADVAGAEEEKEELAEIVDFLKQPDKYGELGAKIPHGVLLMGPPGTGKTLLAKAVAGEANVPFLSISGSDFVEMYVGVGASRVRDLFETARKAPASIVFIDEIDAVGRHRGAGLGGGHDEREQTLNQLLVEMDGFGAHDGIIVMAATNRPDILDPALLRPGRFDRQITVNYPDIKGREEILKVHARNKKFEPDVDFSVIARTTAGFTGADLANLLNEAALLAVRRRKKLIGMPEIEDSFLKVVTGPQKKSLKLGEKEKRNTAYHEAGHAVAGYYLPTSDPVHTISIIPAGQTLGVTVHVPEQDRFSVYRGELEEEISVLLGGRVAELITFGDFSGGASNDIKRATEIAHKMVTQLGMSDLLGPIRYGSSHGDDIFLGRDFSSTQDYSDETAAKIDSEIRRIVNEAYERTKAILTEHSDKLKFVAEYLVSHEMMDGDQFRLAMESEEPTVEALEALAEEKKKKSREANEKAKAKQKEEEEKAAVREDDVNSAQSEAGEASEENADNESSNDEASDGVPKDGESGDGDGSNT
ncbi:MAG: ATP-dependent zinc metalloprotease FtsH [Clostridia bacterium]|nr:ATP-dependent zinc metalloprotease FtsH [Clostridia bacterium]